MKKTVLLLAMGLLLLGASCARKACPAYGSSDKPEAPAAALHRA